MRNPGDSETICTEHRVSLIDGRCPSCQPLVEVEGAKRTDTVPAKKPQRGRKEETCLGCGLPRSFCRC